MRVCKFIVVVCFAFCVLDAESKSKDCASTKGHHNKTKTKDEEWTNSSTPTSEESDLNEPDDTGEWTDSCGNETKIEDVGGSHLGNVNGSDTNDTNITDHSAGIGDESTIVNSTGQYNQSQPQNTTQPAGNITTNVNTTQPADNITTNANTTQPAGNITTNANTTQPAGNITTNANTTQPIGNITTNATQNEVPKNTTTSQNTTQQETKINIGYWVPIFNFGNDFYFGTKNGYTKLVDFPAPVIYSFVPVAAKENLYFGGKQPQGEPGQEFADDIGDYFENELNFADCFANQELGDMIPHSYFGNWVSVFHLENGWNLLTYDGFVPLDMNGWEAPLTYEFDPIVYQYPRTSTPSPIPQTEGEDDGLAQWSEPLVVED